MFLKRFLQFELKRGAENAVRFPHTMVKICNKFFEKNVFNFPGGGKRSIY